MTKIPLQTAPAQCSFPMDKGWKNKDGLSFIEVTFFVFFMGAAYLVSGFQNISRRFRKRSR